MRITEERKWFSMAALGFFMFACTAFGANIDPNNDGHRYAYGGNVGWCNFKPAEGPGAAVEDTRLTGLIWSENIGWIKLDPDFGGVFHDGKGNLSGYAWSENTGWIEFSCKTNNTCDTVNFGVTIDVTTGLFAGYAWGENIGWIKFDFAGFANPAGRFVETAWRINGDVNSDGVVSLADAILTLQVVAASSTETPAHYGADVNGNQCIGMEEAAYVLQRVSGVRGE